ncbi:MAG: phage holin family protein [Desulfovibrio sp.]|jgi:hypothetical protein|nr:phage holin family protein [Desulfovibrio sp.]
MRERTKGTAEMNGSTQISELLQGICVPIVLGIAGSAVRLMRFGFKSWRQLAASITSAIFASVLVYWGLDMLTFPPTVDAAICGASGYMGGMMLDALQTRALKVVRDADLQTDKFPKDE